MTRVNLNEFLLDAFRRQNEGDLRTAETMYRQVLAQFPDHPDALNMLGTLAIAVNQPEPARQILERAIAIYSHAAGYHLNLAMALKMLRRFDEAVASARRAVVMAPQEPSMHCGLAAVLLEAGFVDEALASCERGIAMQPDYFEGLLTLSNILVKCRRPRDAAAVADRAIALKPQHPIPHWNKALAALTAGDFATGWTEFEWRQHLSLRLRRDFTAPIWSKQDLSGKTVLLHCEGGFGDAIQFIRFLPEVVRRVGNSGRVLLECPQPLYELFKVLPGLEQVLARDAAPLPPFDIHCPLQSIPFNVDLTLETIPAIVSYLSADTERAERFKTRIDESADGALKVGLAWAGSENPDDNRSRTLETFAPLAQVPGVRFFSLQVGPSAAEAAQPADGLAVVDLSSELRDFGDLAAAMANLELVISVDTSIAHLVGALGKPVWTLIPFVPDFRWMLDREDSPWYPTMRLFRQVNRTGWGEPLARIVTELQNRASGAI